MSADVRKVAMTPTPPTTPISQGENAPWILSSPDFSDDSEATERAVPFRTSDLIRALASDPSLPPGERNRFLQLARLLAAVLHHEYFDWLVELKDLYSALDPDTDCVSMGEHSTSNDGHADERFLKTFEASLIRANYRPLKLDVIEKAITAPNELGLNYVPDFAIFEHMKIYVRGRTKVSRFIRTVRTKFRRREVVHDGYSRLIVILKFREDCKKLDQYARSDVLYLRMFKDVPHVDMEMHLPEQGTKVKMRMIDKAQISAPIITGIPMLLAKIFMAATINPGLAVGMLVAPFTAGMNSFFGFQRAKQKHLAFMIRHLYYLTLANNASVINRLIDSAEEEDFKEALLAYYILWRGADDPEPWDQHRLDLAVEAYIRERAGTEVDFEVADATRKLFRFGLARLDGRGHITATPIEASLARLDERWDDSFRFDGEIDNHRLG